ncbi:hypothetical protein [Intrasporangium sp. YIM S08009]|uniref:hypothetical protein n=1 Tax=Intrasporangium zincisolvens TaxID=3080018 RepID=UPI002B06080D|nr:hypothetical protein [Intrasporangium sp. YIM S08009]
MSALRRLLALALTAAALAASGVALSPSATAASSTAQASQASSGLVAAGVPCSSVSELGTKTIVPDLGMSAFTVRQYKGWCTDSRGSAWMNFASVYVWEQYHARGFAYRAMVGVAVRGEPETRGFVTGGNRVRTTYSTPVRTVALCTQGWGKLARSGGESAQGLSSLVC